MFAMLPIVIGQNIYQPKAIDSRMQLSPAIYFDPSTGVTSAILTNIEFIGLKDLDDIPLIVVNIPPVRDSLTTRWPSKIISGSIRPID